MLFSAVKTWPERPCVHEAVQLKQHVKEGGGVLGVGWEWILTALYIRSSICFSTKNMCALGGRGKEGGGFPASPQSRSLGLAGLPLWNAWPLSSLLSSSDSLTWILFDRGLQSLSHNPESKLWKPRVYNPFMVKLDLITFGSECETIHSF